MSKCQYFITEAKTIITKSNLPDTDYVINPYIGCQFGCAYCYASFMGRFVKRNIDEWGEYVNIKENSGYLIQNDLEKLIRNSPNSKILLSSVTDPYQPIEGKYKLTQKILNTISDLQYPGMINILTKSTLVLRDVDILKKINQIEVGLTITTTDDELSKTLEGSAPRASYRLKTLEELNRTGINTYAFIGPLLPHYANNPEVLNHLFASIRSTGTKSIYVEYLNTSPYIKKRLYSLIKNNPELLEIYSERNYKEYERNLEELVINLTRKYGFNLKLEQIISHDDMGGVIFGKR